LNFFTVERAKRLRQICRRIRATNRVFELVLEYPNAISARHADWVPRVRKVGRDGKATTLAGFPKKDQ